MDSTDFEADVLRAAPHSLSIGSLRKAIQEFEERGEHNPAAVTQCVLRAGVLHESDREQIVTPPSRRVSMSRQHRSVLRFLRWLPGWAERQRTALFGTNQPPFENQQAAAIWVQHDMEAGAPPTGANRPAAQSRWRDVIDAARRFHETNLGWCNLAPETRTVEFTWRGGDVRRRIFPNATAAVIAFERSVSEIHRRTGISPSSLAQFVLTGRLSKATFEPVAWRLTVYSASGDDPDTATVGEIRVYVDDLRRDELRAAFQEMSATWKRLPTERRNERRAMLSNKLVKLLRTVDAAGGPPARRQVAFWTRVAVRTGYSSWSAAKQAYWRETQKKQTSKLKTS